MELKVDNAWEDAGKRFERVAMYENDVRMSWGTLTTTTSGYNGQMIPTLCFGGIGSAPEYRRGGNVRKIFDYAFQKSSDEPWAVALLHPFSFNYYRKFGFEHVCDHRIVTLSMSALAHLPRCSSFHPIKPDELSGVCALYQQFSKTRNCTLARAEKAFLTDPAKTSPFYYTFAENGVIRAYLKLSTEKKFIVNHMGQGVLTVHELVFDGKDSLYAALGFLRMYEGELETVVFENIAHIPEVELTLTEYIAEKIELVPDVAARVLDTKALLEANTYPQKAGAFVIRVEDSLEKVRGTFRVTYENGVGKVEKLSDTENIDLSVNAPAFIRLVYGYQRLDSARAAYVPGLTLYTAAEDFFLAFPKRPCGVFEHF